MGNTDSVPTILIAGRNCSFNFDYATHNGGYNVRALGQMSEDLVLETVLENEGDEIIHFEERKFKWKL